MNGLGRLWRWRVAQNICTRFADELGGLAQDFMRLAVEREIDRRSFRSFALLLNNMRKHSAIFAPGVNLQVAEIDVICIILFTREESRQRFLFFLGPKGKVTVIHGDKELKGTRVNHPELVKLVGVVQENRPNIQSQGGFP